MSDLGNKQIMAENIRYHMDLNQIDRNRLCSDLGIKYTTLCDWLNGKTYPRIDKIELMANYFGVQKADLVENMRTRHTVDLFSGVGALSNEDTPRKHIQTPGIQITHSDGTVKTFDVNSIIYSIMESVSRMPIEQQELVNNMVGGKKKKIIYVENPQNKKKPLKEIQPHLRPNAAHSRTDIELPKDTDTSDNDIMDDENF